MSIKKMSPPAATGGARKYSQCLAACSSQIPPNAAENQEKKRGGKRSRDKGNRVERALVRLLQDHGFGAERVPLSGAAGGSYVGDLTVPLLGVDRIVEVKARKDGFRELYAWIAERDLLIVKADRQSPLVVLRLELAVRVGAAAEKSKGGAHEGRHPA